MTEEQISKLSPELQRAAEEIKAAQRMISDLCKPTYADGHRDWIMSIPARPDYDPDLVIGKAVRVANAALTWGLQMQEERDARDAQLSRIAETVAALPSITGLQTGCVKDHSLIWMAIRDAQDAYRDTLARHQREAQQHAKRAETAEATIATLTREKEQLTNEIIRLNCTPQAVPTSVDNKIQVSRFPSHTPEGRK